MKLPSRQHLQRTILGIARGKDRVTEPDLYRYLQLEMGLHAAGPSQVDAMDRWLLTASVATVRKGLIRSGFLQPLDAQAFRITPKGKAYLALRMAAETAGQQQWSIEETLFREIAEQACVDQTAVHEEPREHVFEPDEDDVPSHEADNFDVAALLDDAGLTYLTDETEGRLIPVTGAFGSWLVAIRIEGGFVKLSTHAVRLPEQTRARAAVVEAALHANAALTVWKFCLSGDRDVRLECELDADHVDAASLQSTLVMLDGLVSERHAKLVRLASARQRLDDLERIFKRSA